MGKLSEIWNFLRDDANQGALSTVIAILTPVCAFIYWLVSSKTMPTAPPQTPPVTNTNNNRANGGNAEVHNHIGMNPDDHAKSEARILAAIEKKSGIPHETLRKALGNIAASIPDDQLPAAVEKWASEYTALKEQLSKPSNDGEETQALRAQAIKLMDESELEKARALLANANDARRENRQQRNREDASLLLSQAEFENLLFNRKTAINLRKEAIFLDPTNILALVNLGDTLATIGQRQEAQRIFEKAQSQSKEQRLLHEECICLSRIGDTLINTDAPAALRYYQESLAIAEQLVHANENNLTYQQNLSANYSKIGDILKNTDASAALNYYRKDLAIAEHLAETDKNNLKYQRDLSISYNNIGYVLRNIDASETLAYYRMALEIRQLLADTDSNNLEYQRDLALSYNKIGDMLFEANEESALAYYQKALEIRQRLAETDKHNLEYQRELSLSYNKLGNRLRDTNALVALGYFQKALEIRQRLAETDKHNLEYQRELSIAYRNVAHMSQSPRENFGKAHEIFVRLKQVGYLAPSEHWVVEDTARKRDAATH